tara:strand:+ start:96 stop:713 length:618 start_codon:yes stop_codon:yes gene_type:complete
MNNKYLFFKYSCDFIFALIILIILSPLFLIISSLILFLDGKPVIFSQSRIGLNKKIFNFYKFRTMHNRNVNDKNYYTKKGDKRITKLGRILRKYSLDELPQLINILLGDMTFIGPRPPVFDELDFENLTPDDKDKLGFRFYCRPGISGKAQVLGRNANDWSEKIKLDYKYINLLEKNFIMCFMTDIFLVILTIKEILFTSGEYDK